MKLSLYLSLFTAAALACLAGLDYSDIVRWGLVRRPDVAALLPAEGYRMICTTNVLTSWVWTLNGYMNSTDEGKKPIEDVTAQCDRVEKEMYVGREGRQPVLVRVDRCERIVNALTYVSTALLISVLVAAGSLLWQTVARAAAGK